MLFRVTYRTPDQLIILFMNVVLNKPQISIYHNLVNYFNEVSLYDTAMSVLKL